MTKHWLSILFVALALFVVVSVSQVIAATPVAKTFTPSQYSQGCGSGRKGSDCFSLVSLRLTWSHPTQREDGSSLAASDIAYYKLSMRYNGGAPQLLDISKKTDHVLRHKPHGVYVFSLATVTSDKQQSAFTSDLTIDTRG